MTQTKQDALLRIARATGTDVYALARLLRAHGVEVEFAHDNALTLAPTDVAGLKWPKRADAQESAVLVSTHLGLTGATSPLPQETLAALEEAMGDDDGRDLTALLAHLHHTLLSLLHQGMALGQPSTSATAQLTDPMSVQLLTATAHAEGVLPAADRMAAWAALSQPSCDSQHVSWALGTVLRRHHLSTQITCRPLAGTSEPLSDAALWALADANSTLAQSCILGTCAPALAHRVAIFLGPVDGAWLRACQEHVDAVALGISAMLQALLPAHVGADVALVLHADALVPWQLHVSDERRHSPIRGLGVETFLGETRSPQTIFWPVHVTCTEGFTHG